jgi:CRP-like cAMP-binding protein
MISPINDFIRRFAPISADLEEQLSVSTEQKNFDKKVLLTRIGDIENNIYFIVKGLVRVYFLKGKTEIIVHLAKEGEMAGAVASYFSGDPSRYFVETMEPVTAVIISKKASEELYSQNKEWEKIGRIVTAHYVVQQEMRIMDNIRYNTSERFTRFMQNNTDLLQRVPQKYLASYLNIKPETFSRLKKLMQKK